MTPEERRITRETINAIDVQFNRAMRRLQEALTIMESIPGYKQGLLGILKRQEGKK